MTTSRSNVVKIINEERIHIRGASKKLIVSNSSSSNSSLSIERKEEQIVHIKTPNLHVWLAPHTPPPPPLIYNFYIKRIRKPT